MGYNYYMELSGGNMIFVTVDSLNRFLRILGSDVVQEQIDIQYDLFLEEQFYEMLEQHNMMMQSCYSYDNE